MMAPKPVHVTKSAAETTPSCSQLVAGAGGSACV